MTQTEVFLFQAYLIGGGLVWYFVYYYRLKIDQSSTEDLPIPETVDPYQIAYLRGGSNEVIRLATTELFGTNNLVEKKIGWGQVVEWSRKDDEETNCLRSQQSLSQFAKDVLAFYRTPRAPQDIFKKYSSHSWTNDFTSWDHWIEKQQLRIPSDKQAMAKAIGVAAALLFPAAGLAICLTQAVSSSNVFLISMVITTIVGTGALISISLPRRFSSRGKRFIEQLQFAYNDHRKPTSDLFRSNVNLAPNSSFQPHVLTNFRVGNTYPMKDLGASQVAFVLTSMGVFGVLGLEYTPLSVLFQRFRTSMSTGSGCGSSCAGAMGCGSGSDGASSSDGGACCGASCGSGCGSGGGCGGGGCGGGGCGS